MDARVLISDCLQAYAKSINPRVKKGEFGWRTTTPGLLAHAVRTYGWRFIPDQVLPPLVANVAVGAVLYTSYLQILGIVHEPSSKSLKRIYPPPSPVATFGAGFAAGAIQSFIAAPLDALQVRFDKREERYEKKTMWQYGRGKLHETGARGIFAGWGLSFLKDSFGSGIFFATFEYVKAQAYYEFVKMYYGSLEPFMVDHLAVKRNTENLGEENGPTVIKPHYAWEPSFLLLAGVAASVAQQTVLYPLTKVQTLHFERLEGLDQEARRLNSAGLPNRGQMLKAYYHAYQETWKQVKLQAGNAGVRNWLYKAFWWNTVKNVPSTSAGLIIFELFRRRYGIGTDVVKISEDGYDILLS